jgi:hypothetical protein
MTNMTTCLPVGSLLSILLISGCGDTASDAPVAQPSDSAADHGHAHDGEEGHDNGHTHGPGPHGGTVADWGGGKYHVEFSVDHDKQEATVYILGDDQKTPEPIAAESLLLTISKPELQIELKPTPMDGETAELCSKFTGTHEGLATVMEYEGIISAEVDGTPYAGNFKEEAGHEH